MNNTIEKLPESWALPPLESCVDILDNRRVPINSKERAKRKGKVPYYGATRQAGWIDDYIFDEELLLLGEDGAPFFDRTKNTAYIIKGKSWVNNHAHVLRALSSLTSNIYLKHYLNQFDFTGFVGGTTRLKLNQSAMKKILVKLAPLAEQKRIVNVIEKLFVRVNKIKGRLQNATETMKRFRKSVLNAATRGNLMEDVSGLRKCIYLQEVVLSLQNGFSKRHNKNGDSTIVIRLADIANQKISLGNPRRIKMTNKEKSKYSLQRGDILIIRVNGSADLVGRFVLVREDLDLAYCDHFIRMKIDDRKLLPEYLNVVSNSRDIREYISKNLVSTTGQNTVNQKTIGFIQITVPTIDEQRKVVSRVESLFAFADKIEGRIADARDRVEKLTQSILAKAFRGELVPNEAEIAKIEGREYETAQQLFERIQAEKEAKPKRKRRIAKRVKIIEYISLTDEVNMEVKMKSSLYKIISERGKNITPEDLLEASKYSIETIEDFYEELARLEKEGEIEDFRPNNIVSLLRVKK